MLLKIVWEILRRHAVLHLLIPLLAGVAVETFVLWRRHGALSVALEAFLVPERLLFLAATILAYVWVMYVLLKRETNVKQEATGIATLADAVSGATEYFATSTIRMEEWFHPIAQTFLACIVQQKQRGALRDARVLLLTRTREEKGLDLPYLSGYYARRLADLHTIYSTPAAFLRKDEVVDVVNEMQEADRRILVGIGKPRWLPEKLHHWLQGQALRSPRLWRMSNLDFALIRRDGSVSILRVEKLAENLRVDNVTGSDAEPFVRLVQRLKLRLVETDNKGSQHFRANNDFIRRFYPHITLPVLI